MAKQADTDRTGEPGKFTAEERAAMKERAQEVRKGKTTKADGTADVLAKIAELPEPDRTLAQWIHDVVTSTAPELSPRTYYGMPAYARDGKVLCFFQPASKFKVRYGTIGFEPIATLDDGTMWPTAFAVTEKSPANEARIAELVTAAVR